jgi:large subunit ribosomal protein L15
MAQTLHTLKPAKGSTRSRRRVGRGNASGMGTYSTRGSKGQRARSGGRSGLKLKGMKRIIEALPKLGGFKSLRQKPGEVKLASLLEHFNDGATITKKALCGKGLVDSNDRHVKVIGSDTVNKKFTLVGITASAPARAAIEKGGGSFLAKKA